MNRIPEQRHGRPAGVAGRATSCAASSQAMPVSPLRASIADAAHTRRSTRYTGRRGCGQGIPCLAPCIGGSRAARRHTQPVCRFAGWAKCGESLATDAQARRGAAAPFPALRASTSTPVAGHAPPPRCAAAPLPLPHRHASRVKSRFRPRVLAYGCGPRQVVHCALRAPFLTPRTSSASGWAFESCPRPTGSPALSLSVHS